MSEGVGSSRRRSPQCSMIRFQYEPYARRVPAVTAADTTGTYSAKVGSCGRPCGTAVRSATVRPIRSSSTSAACAAACWEVVGGAAGFTAVMAVLP